MSEHNYRVMRAALNLFERSPLQLSAAELQQAREQAAKEQAIEQMILRSAAASAVQVGSCEIEQAVEEIAKRFPDAEQFEQALGDNGLDRESLAHAVANELRVNETLERVAKQVPEVTEHDIEQFYVRHPKRFWRDEMRTVRHILVTINEDIADNKRERAYERGYSLISQLQQTPNSLAEHFAALAQRYSECPSASHGGLIGALPRGQLYPELDARLFRMVEGQISGPLESQMGFHVLFCEAIQPAGLIPLEQVRGKIREALDEKRGEQAKREWVKDLQKGGGC